MDKHCTLKECRLQAGVTQEKLAAALGVDRRTVGRWELKLVAMSTAMKIACAALLHKPMCENCQLISQYIGKFWLAWLMSGIFAWKMRMFRIFLEETAIRMWI